MDWINDILQQSPVVMMVMLLNLVGSSLKKSPVCDWMIPWILGALGAILYPCIADTSQVAFNVAHPVVVQAMQGAFIGGMSVAIHQAVMQFLRRPRGESGNTQFIRRTDPPGTSIREVLRQIERESDNEGQDPR